MEGDEENGKLDLILASWFTSVKKRSCAHYDPKQKGRVMPTSMISLVQIKDIRTPPPKGKGVEERETPPFRGPGHLVS